jgi:hypothetical protein
MSVNYVVVIIGQEVEEGLQIVHKCHYIQNEDSQYSYNSLNID